MFLLFLFIVLILIGLIPFLNGGTQFVSTPQNTSNMSMFNWGMIIFGIGLLVLLITGIWEVSFGGRPMLFGFALLAGILIAVGAGLVFFGTQEQVYQSFGIISFILGIILILYAATMFYRIKGMKFMG